MHFPLSIWVILRKNRPIYCRAAQKQRIAIAGVVAMKPKCIVFDEPTAMLDPKGRQEIMKIIGELHEEGITVILITHFMEEAAAAERVIVMHEGCVLLDGTPAQVFSAKRAAASGESGYSSCRGNWCETESTRNTGTRRYNQYGRDG